VPSGAAWSPATVPMKPPPPALLVTVTETFHLSCAYAATNLATTSTTPPGAYGEISSMFFVGYLGASVAGFVGSAAGLAAAVGAAAGAAVAFGASAGLGAR